MRNIYLIFILAIVGVGCERAPAPMADNASADGETYVLAEFAYGYRNGAAWQYGETLTAYQDSVFDANGRTYWVAELSHADCIDYLQYVYTQDGEFNRFKNRAGTYEPLTGKCLGDNTCYAISGNIVRGTGYRTEYNEFHCIPKRVWDTLRAAADDGCYENTPDNQRRETECPPSHLSRDRDADKSPGQFHDVIKKCSDYRADKLFVCQ